jgi:hypothetical protein
LNGRSPNNNYYLIQSAFRNTEGKVDAKYSWLAQNFRSDIQGEEGRASIKLE